MRYPSHLAKIHHRRTNKPPLRHLISTTAYLEPRRLSLDAAAAQVTTIETQEPEYLFIQYCLFNVNDSCGGMHIVSFLLF